MESGKIRTFISKPIINKFLSWVLFCETIGETVEKGIVIKMYVII